MNELQLTPQTFQVLAEGKNWVAVLKPNGLSCVRLKDSMEPTLTDFFENQFSSAKDYPWMRAGEAGLVHRLDRETSGVTLFARNNEALNYFIDHWKTQKIKKYYTAIIDRTKAPDALLKFSLPKVFELPLGSRYKRSKKVIVEHSDQLPNTKTELISVQALNKKVAILYLRIYTGYRHQIRVTCAHLDSPILGDTLYGGAAFSRMCLHASVLEFTDPTGEKHRVEAPPLVAQIPSP